MSHLIALSEAIILGTAIATMLSGYYNRMRELRYRKMDNLKSDFQVIFIPAIQFATVYFLHNLK